MPFYAYLNIQDPFVAWEAAVGRICSADNLESGGVFSLSLRQFSLFRRYSKDRAITAQLKSELCLEKIRSERYPRLPSRLRGIFLFDSRADAEAAAVRWDGAHFNPGYLSEIEMTPLAQARLDSEWITFNLTSDEGNSWMDSYWRGEVHGACPLTEIICSGVGTILSMVLRERAYRQIMQLFPRSVPLLAIARIAFSLGFTQAGQVVPYLIRDGGNVKGVHILNMNDFNDNSPLFPALAQYGGPWPPLAMPWDGIIQTPDLRDRWFHISDAELFQLVRASLPGEPSNEGALNQLRQVHDLQAGKGH
jgi:hypothetical protein